MSRGRHAAPSTVPTPGQLVAVGTLALATTGGVAASLPTGVSHVPVQQPTVHQLTVVPMALTTTVVIQPPAPVYTVQPGDYLSRIAAEHGLTVGQLYTLNRDVIGGNPNLIFPGQQLKLAGASASVAAPVAQPVAPVASVAPAHAAPVAGAQVVADARHELGVPYVWGGSDPRGFDCSGLVQYVLSQLGVHVPRTSAAQAGAGTPVASLAQAQPGDLVFFYTPITHVGIYIGNGLMIAAPETGENVQIQPVFATPTAIRRVV